jgi:hypothetical protein
VSAVTVTLAVSLVTRWPRIRKFLVELAHYDRNNTRHELPDLHELRTYGQILKRGPKVLDEANGREEDPLEYAKRVWKVRDGRGFGHHAPS